MSRSRKLYTSIIALLFLFFSLNYQAVSTGTNSLFELPLDARRLGIGQVSIVFENKSTSYFDDPPREQESGKSAITSLYVNQFGELNYASLSLKKRDMGFSYRRLSSGKLRKRDLRGNPTGNSFRYFSQGLGGRIDRKFGLARLGIKGQILHKQIERSFLGGSLSPEFTYEIEPFRFGAKFSNLISNQFYPSEYDSNPWAKEVTFGLGIELNNFRAGLEVESEFHDRGVEPNSFRVGGEWWIARFAALRLGIMDDLRHTMGWGIRGDNIQVDYAYLWHAELPNSNFVSVSWLF